MLDLQLPSPGIDPLTQRFHFVPSHLSILNCLRLFAMDRDILRRPLYVVAFLGLLLLYLTTHGFLLTPNEGADAGDCRVVSMYPSFARIRSFDESHTKFASKFSLHLYREQGKDPIPENENEGFKILDGIPALFIPGNAGSYSQMRSIAAEISNLYYDDHNVITNPKARNFDFFGADFNEDFTAFHGRTMLDQAEFLNDAIRFILLLYLNSPNPPTSVLILAHSMGGIVARVLPTLPNYVPGSINTIVTLSSPHSAAPLTFDGDISKIYLAIDRFWYDAFNPGPNSLGLAYQRLHNVSLVSITGGLLDNVLPADYTTLGFLVPPSNGFAVFTTGVPHVWTPMDHLAIVWCSQLRRQVSLMLLDLVDVSSPHRTYPLPKRMAIMRRYLLSGFESYAKKDRFPPLESSDKHLNLIFDERDFNEAPFPNHIWKSTNTRHLLTLFSLSNASTILIIADSGFDLRSTHIMNGISILLCRDWKDDLRDDARTVDLLRKPTTMYTELNCVDIHDQTNVIPRSARDVESIKDSSFEGEKSPFRALRFFPKDFEGYDQLLVLDSREQSTQNNGFVIVERSNKSESHYNLGTNMLTLISKGVHLSFPPTRNLAINVHIPGAWSSILAYKLNVKGGEQLEGSLFEPFIRQWKEEPYETKWHINLRSRSELLVSMHGIAPFTPFNQKPETRGLNLEFWIDPQPDMKSDEINISLKVDWIQSLKLLVLRYRLAVVSQGIAVTFLVTIFQFICFFSSGNYPDFIYGLTKVTQRNALFPILITLFLLTPLTKLRFVQNCLNMIDPVVLQDPNDLNLSLHDDFTLNSFFLGLQENVLLGVSWVFFAMAVSLNFFLYYILQLVGNLLNSLATLVMSIIPKKTAITQQKKVFTAPAIRRKFVTTAAIMCAVLFYVPYQFAYMVSFAIQAITTIKLMGQNRSKSIRNYQLSFLIMMMWVLPINVPVLVVFVHNLNINWTTPFSSHHNFMAVVPIVALSEVHSFFPEFMPFNLSPPENNQRMSKSLIAKVTWAILGYTVFYCIIYGVRHTFWLHHLFNIWCSWLLIGYLDQILNSKDHKSK